MAIRLKKLKVKYVKQLKEDIYELCFYGDDFSDVKHGQFINIDIATKYLKRPISVMDVNQDELKICFKVLGEGTQILSTLEKEDEVEVLYPLGTGYNLPPDNISDVLIVAGGIGTPPLVGWYKYLSSFGKYNIKVILGFKDEALEIYKDEFSDLEIAYDYKDENVIKYLESKGYSETYQNYYTYSCGAMPMLEALSNLFKDGQMLLEERMGCGFGACMGCSRKINETDYKRVCKEGPMFYNLEVRYGSEN